MSASQIDFRPYLNLSAVYATGLTGVGLDSDGRPSTRSSTAMDASVGGSAVHSWKHTQLGLDYRASFRHSPSQSFYDGSDQMLLLGVTQQLSRHVMLSLRTAAGMFS